MAYTQDPKGRISAVTNSDSASSWAYSYDALDQLTAATNAGDGTQTQTFSYDAVGNITQQTGVGAYAYPAAGQPRPHGPASVAGAAYTYDANGNVLTGSGRSFTWDGENRPTTIASIGVANASVSFVYGPDGARLKKIKQVVSPTGVVLPPQVTLYLGRDLEIARAPIG